MIVAHRSVLRFFTFAHWQKNIIRKIQLKLDLSRLSRMLMNSSTEDIKVYT
jgi:hypothetical protein